MCLGKVTRKDLALSSMVGGVEALTSEPQNWFTYACSGAILSLLYS